MICYVVHARKLINALGKAPLTQDFELACFSCGLLCHVKRILGRSASTKVTFRLCHLSSFFQLNLRRKIVFSMIKGWITRPSESVPTPNSFSAMGDVAKDTRAGTPDRLDASHPWRWSIDDGFLPFLNWQSLSSRTLGSRGEGGAMGLDLPALATQVGEGPSALASRATSAGSSKSSAFRGLAGGGAAPPRNRALRHRLPALEQGRESDGAPQRPECAAGAGDGRRSVAAGDPRAAVRRRGPARAAAERERRRSRRSASVRGRARRAAAVHRHSVYVAGIGR
jgi:hypothetical protein